ncbi:MAG: hypothetical protein HWE35_02370 [Rhodobacteraceae bacterium]|nr:hypothetical protein [Paracoccaceae bacterium]
MADRRARRNLNSRLKRRRRAGDPMQAYDALPPSLRQWLADACLPWSPASALRLWTKAGGSRDPAAAVARLDAAEQAMLKRDARVWAFRN